MFRDSPASYRHNPFIEAMSKPGVFSQIFYEGTYLKMDQLFYEGWTEKVSKRMKISRGLFFSIFLADLYDSIQNMKQFRCFENPMRKLSDVKDDFMPTVFEVEMSNLLLHILKDYLKEMEFEGCFKTKGEKEIDLRARLKEEWVYFEMTKVMDYEKCSDILKLYNLLSAFLTGAQMKTHKNLQLELHFDSTPDQTTIDAVIEQISTLLLLHKFNVSKALDQVSFSLKETISDPKLMLSISSDVELNKLKDKYFEELEHFDDNEINVVAVDTTYLPGDPEKYMAATDKIFETEPELSPVAAVIYVTKEHFVKANGLPLKTLTKCIIKYNKNCGREKVHFLKNIFVSK